MGNIIPFDKAAGLPAHVRDLFKPDDDLVVAGGFPVLSIKGKTFHVVRGEDRELVTDPKTGEQATGIEVCIVAYNSAVSKVYYKGKFVEGSNDSPTCYSNDGVAPAADSEVPQAKSCAACPNNVWGSRMTEDDKKAKACADVRRVAVATPDAIDDPMLLRIPATSLKTLGEYQAMLKKRGVGIRAVATRISFDTSAAYPSLLFKPIGFVDDEAAAQIVEMADSLVVKQILGLEPVAAPEPAEEAPKSKAKAQPAPAIEDDDEDDEGDEEPVAEAPKPTKKKAAKKAAAKKPEPAATDDFDDDDDFMASLDAALGND